MDIVCVVSSDVKGKERKEKERKKKKNGKEKERKRKKRKERRGKERKGEERKGKERKVGKFLVYPKKFRFKKPKTLIAWNFSQKRCF